MVYYRKYRPQKISELDLESVRNRLNSILSARELPHAFLFTGPKGLGKTSAARILAKAINCEKISKFKIQNSKLQVKDQKSKETKKIQQSNNETIEPCNACDNCVSISNGSNFDVVEIDAASNRGIDEIRDLREKIKFAPASLRKKVYIIDEVHMLTNEAFNALLKSLEEPPSHVVFILCTTEAEKVPPTIASRAFHVRFEKPTKEELLHSLGRIVDGEELKVEKEVLNQICKLSEGSFRDAAKILEDLNFSSDDGDISLTVLEKNYKSETITLNASKLLASLAKKNFKESLSVIQDLESQGVDFKIFTEKLAEVLHALILASEGLGKIDFETPPFTNRNELKDLLEKVNDSYKNIKFSILPQIPLELVVVEWCLDRKTEDGRQKPEAPTPEIRTPISGNDMFAEDSKSNNFFAALISAVKHDNHSIAGILRGCRLIEIGEGKVTFETRYKFHKDRLNDAKARSILDKRASELLHENVQVIVNLIGQQL